jgi:hypothetical protein
MTQDVLLRESVRKYLTYCGNTHEDLKLRHGAVGNLSGVKPYERVEKCSWVKFK